MKGKELAQALGDMNSEDPGNTNIHFQFSKQKQFHSKVTKLKGRVVFKFAIYWELTMEQVLDIYYCKLSPQSHIQNNLNFITEEMDSLGSYIDIRC